MRHSGTVLLAFCVASGCGEGRSERRGATREDVASPAEATPWVGEPLTPVAVQSVVVGEDLLGAVPPLRALWTQDGWLVLDSPYQLSRRRGAEVTPLLTANEGISMSASAGGPFVAHGQNVSRFVDGALVPAISHRALLHAAAGRDAFVVSRRDDDGVLVEQLTAGGSVQVLRDTAASLDVAGIEVIGEEVVIATRTRTDPRGNPAAAIAAVSQVERGGGASVAHLDGSPGALVHWRNAEQAPRMEPFPLHRPAALAVTDDGWLVVLTEGTFAGGLRDAALVARRTTEQSDWRLLASSLEMPGQVVHRGPWVCFAELLPNTANVHCINPTGRTHRVARSEGTRVALFDIHPVAEGYQLVFKRTTYVDNHPIVALRGVDL